ncbi:MAG: cytochrome c oxidase subunit 3 [Planctomycetes bacterium]|nr:cytochrome c oxidase subunit 3 [Planctomycetota bacterium]
MTLPRPPSARAAETLLVAFLATVTMLFAGFTSAYLIRRTGSDWARLELSPLVYVNTLVLLGASVTLELARTRGSALWPRAAALLGCLFLIGQVLVWRTLSADGQLVWHRPQGAFFFLLSLVHGLHLAGGLIALVWLLTRHARLHLVVIYWHFLALAWIYVLALLRFQ